jgi:CheY-like chemotaxis protein
MSHEIRTPMNAIVGLTEMMRREVRDARQRERLEKMMDASRHLLAIINNVLDLSKIEAGKLVLEEVEFELCDVLDNTFALVIEEARKKGLELVLDASEAPRRVVGDSTRLGQALLNLLSNAVKFTDVGYVALRLRQQPGAENHVTLRFEVSDSGIGIAPDALDKLFKAFEQGDSSTTRRYGGTGLGLAITYELAELMGGRAGACSRLGHGSTFWFTAKLRPAEDRSRDERRWTNVRALVYNDMPVACRAIVATLAQLGVTADEAGSADEVPALLQQARRREAAYDLLVWDADSHVGADQARSSLQMLTSMRKAERVGLAIVVTTMRPASALRTSIRGLGRSTVLEKPITAAAMEQAVRALFADAAVQAADPGADDDTFALEVNRPFEGRQVLLAEDNPVNQMVAVDQLRSLGLDVDVAENGLEALDKARATRYDLILMDLHMPEMDGLEATRAIRRLPMHGSTPILAMTASAFGEDRSASLTAGMDDHISKPVETKVLVRTLSKWLQPARPVQAAAVLRPAGR